MFIFYSHKSKWALTSRQASYEQRFKHPGSLCLVALPSPRPRDQAEGKREMDEIPLPLDVLSPEERHSAFAHPASATLDGTAAGNVVQMGDQEEQRVSLVTSYSVLLQQVRATVWSGGWGEGCPGSAGISPAWERTSPKVGKLKEPALPADGWHRGSLLGVLLWARDRVSGQVQWKPVLSY